MIRLIEELRKAWPNTVITVRGDAMFSSHTFMEWADTQRNVRYCLGYTGNRKLNDNPQVVTVHACCGIHPAVACPSRNPSWHRSRGLDCTYSATAYYQKRRPHHRKENPHKNRVRTRPSRAMSDRNGSETSLTTPSVHIQVKPKPTATAINLCPATDKSLWIIQKSPEILPPKYHAERNSEEKRS